MYSYLHIFLDLVTKNYKPPTIQDAAGYDDNYDYGNESDEDENDEKFMELMGKFHEIKRRYHAMCGLPIME